MSLRDLLSRGYFPKELPSVFTTESFATLISTTATLGGSFGLTIPLPPRAQLETAKVYKYSLARGGLLRRTLSVCNPVIQYHISREMVASWQNILPKISGTTISATAPEFKTSGRAIDGKYSQEHRKVLARNNRIGMRYILETDISRFYGSIYTHAIPWALHTKVTAKTNRNDKSLLGNKLDFLVRQGQDGQTIGIPIGPDTSLVLSEILMQRCDEALKERMPNLRGHRFIDDYELSFSTRQEAEDAYHYLEAILADYELALNPKKTRVIELPASLEREWIVNLKRFTFRTTKSGQAADLEAYFDTAYQLHKVFPDEAVLKYAISRLRSINVDLGNWELLQRLLLLCVAPEPASLQFVMAQIIRLVNSGLLPINSEIERVANQLIRNHAPLGHSSEVAYSLWTILSLGLKLDSESVDVVSRCPDSAVALLALDCEQRGLSSKPLDKTLWMSCMNSDALYDDQWLLSYEANVKGWLPSSGPFDHVAADPTFGFLKANGVSFYDPAQVGRIGNYVVMPSYSSIQAINAIRSV